jgi:hypothetical protein
MKDPMPCEEYVLSRMGSECAEFVSRYRRDADFAEAVRLSRIEETVISSERRAQIDFERHRWLYDRLSLGTALQRAGCTNVCCQTATESAIPDFQSYALDTDLQGRVRKPDSLFIEGKKPERS